MAQGRWAMVMAVALGCGDPASTGNAPASVEASATEGSLASSMASAAHAFDVPEPLLWAIGRAETGLRPVVGHEEFPGRPASVGVMGLRADRLADAAARAGVAEDDARHTVRGNIWATAAWLSDTADLLDIDRDALGDWAPVVAAYADIDHPEALATYVHDAVYGALERGIVVEGGGVPKVAADPAWPAPTRAAAETDAANLTGDSGSLWTASPNYNSRNGASADFVIIHSCEGSYAGCWGWLATSGSGVSAHYVVNDDGSEVRQLVDEDDRAWHISASYDCANNSSVECWRNGASMNTASIGIEHAGFASQSSWDAGLIQRSAELTCGITQRHGIVRDAYHIVAHGTLQPWNRTDPGPNWPWSDYLNRVDVACGDGGGTPTGNEIVIDSNNAANTPGLTETLVSDNWISSANVPGFYNTGYWVAPTEPISDAARFRFNLANDACYEVQAWWAAATDRSPTAPFIWYDASGSELDRRNVDQRVNGGRWNSLGYGIFTPGWNEVILSRWTGTGAYVVADAVRLVPSEDCAGWTGGIDPDTDGDGTPDALDGCANDPDKTDPGDCGCGTPDEDITGDGLADCTVCGDGNVDFPETCDDGGRVDGDGCTAACGVEDLTLMPLDPEIAGVTNTLTSWGGTPSVTTWYVLGWQPGWTQVPGCPGVFVPMRQPLVIGSATSNPFGLAQAPVNVPASAAGVSFFAMAVEVSTCRVSSGVWFDF